MKRYLALILTIVLAFVSMPMVSAEAREPLMTIDGKSLYEGQSPEEIAATFGQPG